MTPSPAVALLTIGHSNHPADRFIELLKSADVTAIADVRSVPFSRWCPWFTAQALAERLAREGIAYLPFGDTLGGRPRDRKLYRDGVIDYEAVAATPEFRAGLDRLIEETGHHRLCLMCSEREPLDCHRFLLVARALAERGLAASHILVDGRIEPQAAAEGRLLALAGGAPDLLHDDAQRLAAAYRRRAGSVGAKLKS
jgi:uncharacterized protein (DUF488 family)